MFLKQIEMFGFKSFAERTVISFEQGVTCIVGPNGCGKSNVSDAIRWVLGERSAKLLRGLSMEDVIFSGTEFRKPVNFSEVSLTFDNHSHALPIDFEEVEITRRLHRSGESEYLINKTTCRLKDIYDLILDTGIGSNSYSMIEQGRIDYILNAAPEERRHLIEEAAGISKYKVKKEEALRKLERTEQNLIRLADIVSEVERNIRYAERQAKRAERYKSDLNRLKELEKRKALLLFKEREERKQEARGEYESWTTHSSELQNEIDQLRVQIRLQDDALRSLDPTLSKEEGERSAVQQKLITLENYRKFNDEKIETLKLASEKALGEISSLNQNIARTKSEASQKEIAFSELNRELELLQNDIEAQKHRFESQTVNPQNTEVLFTKKSEQVFELAHRMTQLQNELTQCQTLKTAQTQSLASHQGRLKNLESQKFSMEDHAKLLHEKRLQFDFERSKFEEEMCRVALEREKLDQAFTDAQMELRELETEKARLLRQVELLTQFQAHTNRNIDTLVRATGLTSSMNHTIFPLLDLIKINSGYEKAVQGALANSLNSLVVDTAEAAQVLIRHILNNNLTRTSIFVRDQIKSGIKFNRIPEFETHPLISGKLLDQVQVRGGYELIFQKLLGHYYLIQELIPDNSSILAQLAEHAHLVTKNGVVFGSEFYVSAGRNYFDFEEGQIENAEALIKDIEQKLTAVLNQVHKLEENRESSKNTEQHCAAQLSALGASQEHVRGQLAQVDDRLKHLTQEIYLLHQESHDFAQAIAESERTLADFEQVINSLVSTDLELKMELDVLRSERDEDRLHASTIRQEMRHHHEILEIRIKSQNEIRTTLQLLSEQARQAVERIQTLDEERETAQVQIKAIVHESAGFESEMSELSHRLVEHSVKIAQIKEKQSEFLKLKTENLENSHLKEQEKHEVGETLHRLELASLEIEHEKQSILKELENRYKITESDLFSQSSLASIGEVEFESEELAMLREKLDVMPTVNLLAIDEYEELKQRFEFLEHQKNDLTTAKESLLETIRHINRTTKRLFDDTLEKVRLAFESYFRELFEGGAADLVLLDTENPLESGLDILARPAGKKLQHISLLSGGEKALTAIALLLALFSVRPSPVCVLDEVDAPLDEANNERFLHVLKPFLQNTQFIIITHSRKTISMGDALYGVTMQEPGVSSIVSVKFSKSSETLEHPDAQVSKELTQILT